MNTRIKCFKTSDEIEEYIRANPSFKVWVGDIQIYPMNTDLFYPPRWPGGPKICKQANLPAFVDAGNAQFFHATKAPGCKIVDTWYCDFCHHFHCKTKPRSPSGDSSGSSRR